MAFRVLHLIHGLGGGGAERQISYLAPSLANLDIDVHVAYVSEGSNFARLKNSNCHMHKIAAAGNYDPRLYVSISRLIKNLQPALIQTWLPQMDILGGLAAIRHRIPYVLSERNTGLAHQNNLRSRVRRWVGGRAVAIVSNSRQGLEYWSHVDEHIVKRPIPNGLPISELDRFRKKASTGSDQMTGSSLLLFAGRFTPAKNVELVVDTFVEVAKRRDNVIGRLFGNGPLEEEMRRRVMDSGLGNRIQIDGYANDLWQWLADADVFVSLSAYEGQPNVVLEAAAIGCPLLLSDIPAHREILRKQEAQFISELTTAASVETVNNILDDPEAAFHRAAMARKAVEGYSIEICALRYRDLYAELLSDEVRS